MAIPDFEAAGILPTGIHECDLSEIEGVFVYNGQRRTVWSSFSSYLSQVIAIPEVNVVYVDGGFVTNKDLPKDVDIVIEFEDFATLLNVWSQNQTLFNHDAVKQAFDVDLYFATVQSGGLQHDFRAFFQYLRADDAIDRGVPVGTLKGILKISLNDERQRQSS